MKFRWNPWAATLLLLGIWGTTLGLPVASADERLPSRASMKAAVEKGLPYLQDKGQWWIDKKECMSCHRVSFTAWSHIEAEAAGIDVDREQVNEWIDWCHDNLFEPFPEEDQKYPGEKTIERNLSGAAQMLALTRRWKRTEEQQQFQSEIVAALLKGQQPSGGWAPKGQLPGQKRSLEETSHVITIWNTLALAAIQPSQSSEPKVDSAIQKAVAFAESWDQGESTEWLALRAWLADSVDHQKTRDAFLKQLEQQQNPDGGFGWLKEGESDALATGQITFALLEMQRPVDDPMIAGALKFLLEKQQEDGRWRVKGTKVKAKDRVQETSSYWGSAWSVMAISRALQKMPADSVARLDE